MLQKFPKMLRKSLDHLVTDFVTFFVLICIYSFYTVLHVAARFFLKIVKMWVSPLVHDAIQFIALIARGVGQSVRDCKIPPKLMSCSLARDTPLVKLSSKSVRSVSKSGSWIRIVIQIILIISATKT